jgi:hypothetical protein
MRSAAADGRITPAHNLGRSLPHAPEQSVTLHGDLVALAPTVDRTPAHPAAGDAAGLAHLKAKKYAATYYAFDIVRLDTVELWHLS